MFLPHTHTHTHTHTMMTLITSLETPSPNTATLQIRLQCVNWDWGTQIIRNRVYPGVELLVDFKVHYSVE